MNKKNNLRYQENEQKIRNCFIALLDTTDIDHITVRMICEDVGIHRSTFYTHYEDIYDLLRRTEKEMNQMLYAQIRELMEQEHFYQNPAFFIRFLEFMKLHRTFYHACLKKRTSFPIEEGLSPLFEDIIKPACIRNKVTDKNIMFYYFTFSSVPYRHSRPLQPFLR